MKRTDTYKIKVGNIYIGASNNIIIQSMCNTKTKNVNETINLINRLEDIGCELVRVSVPDEESALAIEKIKEKIHIPLVADIHFDYKLALMCAKRGIDKIRINPGNIGSEDKVKEVAKICKIKNIPIRIGVNSGSLSKDILIKYNNKVTVDALVEQATREIKILNKFDFDDIIISIKSSDVVTTVKAYEKFSKKYKYPLHIGITEAGTLYSGNIKSSVGLGILIYEGLGNTMRVSLTGDPKEEIKTAKMLLSIFGLRNEYIDIISCPTCARTNINIEKIAKSVEDKVSNMNIKNINKKIKVAIMGCAVNGPGEAREADIGIAGGINEGILFKKGKIIKKVEEQFLEEELLKELNELIK